MSTAFTCVACGGFKYNQESVLFYGKTFCIDCIENGATDSLTNFGIAIKKPGLHEILLSIYNDSAELNSVVPFDKWIVYHGSEEKLAERLLRTTPIVWRKHYRIVIGEEWK
jgi:hypothetical protein